MAEKAKGARESGTERGTMTRSHDATASPSTLDQMGITKDQSSRYQRLAEMPEERSPYGQPTIIT